MARCTVVGGGLSGLATAYLLSRLPKNQVEHVYLYEKSSKRFGGCFLTAQNPHTGALHDLGPHSARISTPSVSPLLRLISSLGFTPGEISWMPPLTRYIYASGALRPINLFSLKTDPPFSRSHLSLFIRRAFAKGPGPLAHDISVDDFLRTRFDDEFADYLGTALMRGVCGVDSKLISASAFLNHLITWEKEAPNLFIGAAKDMVMGRIRSIYPTKKDLSPHALSDLLPPLAADMVPPPNAKVLNFSCGMQALTDRLVEKLSQQSNVTLKKGVYAKSLHYQGRHYQLDICENESKLSHNVEADAVFICTPANQMSKIMGSKSLIPSNITHLLSPKISAATSIGVVALEFDFPNSQLPRGFGHLLPLPEDDTVMGVIYDSCCSPSMDGKISEDGRKTTRLTVMISPKNSWLKVTACDNFFELGPDLRNKMVGIGIKAVREQLGVDVKEPCFVHAVLWNNSIPAYPVGHLNNVQEVRNAISSRLGPESEKTLQLVGSALDGIGISDCVVSAVKAVNNFCK